MTHDTIGLIYNISAEAVRIYGRLKDDLSAQRFWNILLHGVRMELAVSHDRPGHPFALDE